MAQETGREDLLAAAPDDLAVEDLGRLVTRQFRPLTGATSSILPSDPAAVRTTSRTTTDRVLQIVETASELQANASAWGIGAASATAETASHHMYYRAYEVREIRSIQDSVSIPSVPAGAEWYISAVYVGRMLEAHFSSRDTAIGGSVTADGIVGSASIAGFAREHALEFHIRTLGFEPSGDDALFASTPSEMRTAYAATGDAVPILVRYSRVPRTSMPAAAAGEPRQISLLSVRFPQVNPRRGTSWDVFGGNPDILIHVQQGSATLLDRFLGQDMLEWSGNIVLGPCLSVTPETPIVFTFTDRDVADHDPAGSTTLSTAPSVADSATIPATDGGVTIQLHSERCP